jgi:preprotein translocase subunit SecE
MIRRLLATGALIEMRRREQPRREGLIGLFVIVLVVVLGWAVLIWLRPHP